MNIFNVKTLVLLFFVSLSAFSVEKSNTKNPVQWDKLHGLGTVEYFQLANNKTGKSAYPYHIFVRLPDEYDTQKSQSFPVLYLLDGGTNFPLFAANYTQLRFMDDIPPMIIVGISYGAQDWRQGNDRSHDFTVPSTEREHWGGAQVFETFLSDTVLPAMQRKYKVDKEKQILFGQSLGGQFALFTSMYGQAPFYAVIASNPALHRNLGYFKQPMKARKARPKIFVSLAEFDDPTYKKPAIAWLEHWQQSRAEWDYQIDYLKGHNHLSATPDALRNGLMWVFSN
jgi:predicted alpha/beta superfamily hydrolase